MIDEGTTAGIAMKSKIRIYILGQARESVITRTAYHLNLWPLFTLIRCMMNNTSLWWRIRTISAWNNKGAFCNELPNSHWWTNTDLSDSTSFCIRLFYKPFLHLKKNHTAFDQPHLHKTSLLVSVIKAEQTLPLYVEYVIPRNNKTEVLKCVRSTIDFYTVIHSAWLIQHA